MSAGIEVQELVVSRQSIAQLIAQALGHARSYEIGPGDLENQIRLISEQRSKILRIGSIVQCPTHSADDIVNSVHRLKEEHRRVTSEHASALATERAAHEAEKRRAQALEADLSTLRAELASRKLCPAPQPARPAGSADRLDEVLSARLIARAQLPAGVLGSASSAALATMLAEQLGAALDALGEARDEDQ